MSAIQQKYHLEKSNLPGLAGETSVLKNQQGEISFFVKEVTLETSRIFHLAPFVIDIYKNLNLYSDENEIKNIIQKIGIKQNIFTQKDNIKEQSDKTKDLIFDGDHKIRNTFLNEIYESLPNHHQQKLNQNASFEYNTTLEETLLLELLNLLGIKTPTEIHTLKTEKGFIIIKSKVGYQENKIIPHLEHQKLPDLNLDPKSFIRYFFVSNILQIHDINFEVLTNALMVKNKNQQKKLKPNIFDPKFEINYEMNLKDFIQKTGKQNFIDQENFPNLFEEIIEHTNSQETYKDLTKILYCLEKNHQEIQSVLQKYINLVDADVLKTLENNLKNAKNHLKNHLKIKSSDYNPNLNGLNKHEAYKVPRQLSEEILKNIAQELGYKNYEIVNSFVANEVKSRNPENCPQKPKVTRIISKDLGYASINSNSSSINSNGSYSGVILPIKRTAETILPKPKKLQKAETILPTKPEKSEQIRNIVTIETLKIPTTLTNPQTTFCRRKNSYTTSL